MVDKLLGENQELRSELEFVKREKNELQTHVERNQFMIEDENRKLASENFYKTQEINRYHIISEEAAKSIDLWKHECEVFKDEAEARAYADEEFLGRINDLQTELEAVKTRELGLLSEISRLKSAENILAERDHHVNTLEGIIQDLRGEVDVGHRAKSDIQSENKILLSKMAEIDEQTSFTINNFEKNVDVMKTDLKGYYELIVSQENCINSMKDQNERLIAENQGIRIELRNMESFGMEIRRENDNLKEELEIVHRKREKILNDNTLLLKRIDTLVNTC